MASTPRKRGDGEGSIRELSNRPGTWQGRLRWVDADGVAQRKSVYGTSAGDVRAKLRQMRDDLDEGVTPTAGRMTVARFVDVYVDTVLALEVADGTTSREHADARGYLLRRHVVPKLGHRRLDELTVQHVRALMLDLSTATHGGRDAAPAVPSHTTPEGRYVRATPARPARPGKPYSLSARRLVLLALRALLDAAVADKLARRNVARDVKLPREARGKRTTRAVKAYEPADVRRILDALDGDRRRALVLVYLGTGARRHELVDLMWGDVDLDAGLVTIRESKTDAGQRDIAVAPVVVEALRAHRREQLREQLAAPVWVESGHVFTTPAGRALRPDWVTRQVGALLVDLGLKAPGERGAAHLLRHTYATSALAAGAAPADVARNLGHESAHTTLSVYAHATTTGQHDTAARAAARLGLG